MYALDMPVSAIRTKVRQEFERHRYVNKMSVVDVLLFQSHSEFQVRVNKIVGGLRVYIRHIDPIYQGGQHPRIYPRTCSFGFSFGTLILLSDNILTNKSNATGNAQFLETAFPCHEIFQNRV